MTVRNLTMFHNTLMTPKQIELGDYHHGNRFLLVEADKCPDLPTYFGHNPTKIIYVLCGDLTLPYNKCCITYSCLNFDPLPRTSKQYLQSRPDLLLSWSPEVLAGKRFHQLYSEHLEHRVYTDVYLSQPQFHRWESLYLPPPPIKKREIRRLSLDKVE